MSRYTGPANKKSRRVGFSTLENGKDLAKRPYKPGQHGQDRKAKASNYSIQLNEKQKVKFTYGLNEKQFRLLFNKAGKMQGIHGENFLRLLESRLDNIVYRMGLSRTRRGARQIVNHGHILVNGKKVDIPSFKVSVNDVVSVCEKSRGTEKFKTFVENPKTLPKWLEANVENYEGKVVAEPAREDIDVPVNETLIVELYSK